MLPDEYKTKEQKAIERDLLYFGKVCYRCNADGTIEHVPYEYVELGAKDE